MAVPSNDTYITKSDLIAKFIAERKVPSVFLLSGGMIAFLADAIYRLGETPIVNTRHEQSAGFAAEGATRITNIPTIAMATSGPGATNLITSIASSFFDSIPTIFLTGQVNQTEIKKTSQQRQNGFQELDIVDMVKNITKYSLRVDSKTDLYEELNKMWATAISGRPGPVLLDIPIDVQQEIVLFPNSYESQDELIESETVLPLFIETILTELRKSSRPIILVGGGVRASGSSDIFRNLSLNWKIPVVHSLMAVDVLDSSSLFRVGMIGSYGNRWANQALAKSDLVIALGTRLDVRQTGHDLKAFVKDKRIIRVDVDNAELNGRLTADVSFKVDLKKVILALNETSLKHDFSEWNQTIRNLSDTQPQKSEQSTEVEFNPDDIMKWISQISSRSAGYVVDVGQHQMWAAQSLNLGVNQRFITSGGLGSMGFALPAAIGASFTDKKEWTVITGDGCTQLSISELQTIKHYNIPIKVCILNNNQHGMVAQFQENNLQNRFVGTREDYSAPNFSEVSRAFGIEAIKLSSLKELYQSTDYVLNWNSGPIILEFMISNKAKALPKLSMDESIHDL
jgi:acetolactate synthase-1/2/3 large subunit